MRSSIIGAGNVGGALATATVRAGRKLHFPLLADFEPKGRVSRAYGCYQRSLGESGRALFVLDGAGVIRWSYRSPVGVNPGADGILAALDDLAGKGASA